MPGRESRRMLGIMNRQPARLKMSRGYRGAWQRNGSAETFGELRGIW